MQGTEADLLMSQESLSETMRVIVWLAIYGATALSLAFALFRIVWGPSTGVSQTARTGLGVLFAIGLIPALDFGKWAAPASSETGGLLTQALFLAAGMLLGRFVLSWDAKPLSASPFRTRFRFSACLLAAGLPTLFWSSHRLRETPANGAELTPANLSVPSAENLTEVAEIELLTDRGERIPAYRFANSDNVSENKLASQLEKCSPINSQAVIMQAPAGIRTNCHGWVFAEGKYIIRGEAVDRILQDNGYRTVTEPQPGDLIVYRDANNGILHTGVVKATGADGFSLIESKWGLHGRYLHEPEQQSYSDRFAYYRSPRPGHQLSEAGKNAGRGRQRAELKAADSRDDLAVAE